VSVDCPQVKTLQQPDFESQIRIEPAQNILIHLRNHHRRTGLGLTTFLQNTSTLPISQPQAGVVQAAFGQSKKFVSKSGTPIAQEGKGSHTEGLCTRVITQHKNAC